MTGERKWIPRTIAISRIVAAVTKGSPSSIARHSATCPAAAPVIPTSASPSPNSFAAKLAVSRSCSKSPVTAGSKKT